MENWELCTHPLYRGPAISMSCKINCRTRGRHTQLLHQDVHGLTDLYDPIPVYPINRVIVRAGLISNPAVWTQVVAVSMSTEKRNARSCGCLRQIGIKCCQR